MIMISTTGTCAERISFILCLVFSLKELLLVGATERISVETSDNIFLEDLHNTRDLEATYYVTTGGQSTDFFWRRDSGLEVNIGVHNIHVIPEYSDMDHASDNEYMMNIPGNVPGSSAQRKKFRQIIESQCRHPIPDHYTVTLEVSPDRITAAEEVLCDSVDTSRQPCPPGYSDGDIFLNRTLNDRCRQMSQGTHPRELHSTVNSIVCTTDSRLLQEVFNQPYGKERPLRFPPQTCTASENHCNHCLNQQTLCKSQGPGASDGCSESDCHNTTHCQHANSDQCVSAPVECAMGNAYRYTIVPAFQRVSEGQFMCHIKLRQSPILYQLILSVRITDLAYQTPRMFKTVYAGSLDHQGQGIYHAGPLIVEHNTGLNLEDEFILLGQINTADGRYDYSVHPLKQLSEFNENPPLVHELTRNIRLIPTQFGRPFEYSSSNWRGDGECNKNSTAFHSVQTLYKADGQSLDVVIDNNEEQQFRYLLRPKDSSPFIKFTLSGQTSILPYFLQDGGGSELFTNESLTTELYLTSDERIWEIVISGVMSDCPSYIGVTISNSIDMEELGRYDMLIACPPNVKLTFKLPDTGQDPHQPFDIKLRDLKHTHDISDRVSLTTSPADTPFLNVYRFYLKIINLVSYYLLSSNH